MDIITALFAWARSHSLILWGVSIVSLVAFIGTLAALPLLVARIPEDYFLRSGKGSTRRCASLPAHLPHLIAKNLAGVVFIVVGVVMLFTPGQGILSILIGIMLMNFPGKRSLELRAVRQPRILGAINWMRARSQRPPLMVPRTGPVEDDN